MHIITQQRIREAQVKFPSSASALRQWMMTLKKARVGSFAELKALSGSVDKVGNYFVFNIGGNKLRLIAAIHFNTGKLFIRDILTHNEYDEEKWK